jgi:hypothetical protein
MIFQTYFVKFLLFFSNGHKNCEVGYLRIRNIGCKQYISGVPSNLLAKGILVLVVQRKKDNSPGYPAL